jgi:hypothetical protein
LTALYCLPSSPQRLAALETGTGVFDWAYLDEIVDTLTGLAPTVIVWPRELDPCSECPELQDGGPNDAEAEIVYSRVGSHWEYREPVARCCAGAKVKQLLASKAVDEVRIEIPVPVASGAVA